MLESQRDQLYNQQYNMEQASFALESTKDSVNQIKAMKAANNELKQAFGQKELNINNIDKLHDDMADMMVSFSLLFLHSSLLLHHSVHSGSPSRTFLHHILDDLGGLHIAISSKTLVFNSMFTGI